MNWRSRKVVLGATGILVLGAVMLYLNRPRSIEDHSLETAHRYLRGDIEAIFDHRLEAEKQEVPEKDALKAYLRKMHDRILPKVELVGLKQAKGSQMFVQAHTTITLRSKIHGGEFQVLAPCHLTDKGVRSPLSYYYKFLWMVEYLAEEKTPRPDVSTLVESNYRGLVRDGQGLKQAGLRRVSGQGIRFSDFETYEARVKQFRNEDIAYWKKKNGG
jgi:hypothetical protein